MAISRVPNGIPFNRSCNTPAVQSRPDAISVKQYWQRYWVNEKAGESMFESSYPGVIKNFVFRTLTQVRPSLKAANIADIGAGAELYLSRAIKRRFPDSNVFALDILDEKNVNAGGLVEYRCGSAYQTGYDSGSFDAAVFAFSMDYLDRELCLAEARRILRPGGLGIFVLHHPLSQVVYGLRNCVEWELSRIELIMRLLGQVKQGGFLELYAFLKDNFLAKKNKLLSVPDEAVIFCAIDRLQEGTDSREIKTLLADHFSLWLSDAQNRLGVFRYMLDNLFATREEGADFFSRFGFSVRIRELRRLWRPPISYGVVAQR